MSGHETSQDQSQKYENIGFVTPPPPIQLTMQNPESCRIRVGQNDLSKLLHFAADTGRILSSVLEHIKSWLTSGPDPLQM